MRKLKFAVNDEARVVSIVDETTGEIVKNTIWATHFPISDDDITLMKTKFNFDVVPAIEQQIRYKLIEMLKDHIEQNDQEFSKNEILKLLIEVNKFKDFLIRIPKPDEIN